jgi:hypothetical protein
MNISGYIPSRNRTQVAFPERSFEEMAWGPSLLMKREEEQDKGIADISTDISNNSYYLDADDKNVAPIVESLQREADDLANEAATKGYDPMLSNKLIAFRRKYQKALSQNEPWGKAVINYKDATAQWKQWEEAHKNDPQEFKQKAKKYFFGQYQGAVDDETPGQLRGFDAGSLPNYYDVNKDIREALKDATGKIGQIVGSEGSSIKVDTSSGTPMLKVFNSNTGQYMDNLQPLLAGAQALMDDFSGAYGADTDRARYARMQGITPEYLANTVANLTQSQRDSYYSQLPSSSGSYQSIPQGNKEGRFSPDGWGFPTYSDELSLGTNREVIKTRDKVKGVRDELINNNIKTNIPEALAKQEIQNIAYKILSSNPNMGMDVALKSAKEQFERTPSGKAKMFSDLKRDYSNLLLPNMTDIEFLSAVDSHLAERSANTTRLKSLDSEDAMKLLETNIGLDNEKALTRIKKGDKRGPENTSFAKFRETFGSETAFGRKQVFYDENLNAYIQDGNNNVYKINKNLSDINPTVKAEHTQLRALDEKTNLTNDEIKQINQSPVRNIPGDLSGSQYVIRIGKDSSGKLVKQVKMFSPNSATGQYDEKIVPLEEFANSYYPNKAMKIIFTDLSKYNK